MRKRWVVAIKVARLGEGIVMAVMMVVVLVVVQGSECMKGSRYGSQEAVRKLILWRKWGLVQREDLTRGTMDFQ